MALQQVGQARDALDVNVKRTFIDPLQELHSTELKEIRVRSRCSPAQVSDAGADSCVSCLSLSSS